MASKSSRHYRNQYCASGLPPLSASCARSTHLHSCPRAQNVEISVDVLSSTTINIDIAKFRQIVWNLLLNSVQASPNGHVVIRTTEGNNQYVIEIIDDGKGIPAEDLQKVAPGEIRAAFRHQFHDMVAHAAQLRLEGEDLEKIVAEVLQRELGARIGHLIKLRGEQKQQVIDDIMKENQENVKALNQDPEMFLKQALESAEKDKTDSSKKESRRVFSM